MENKKNNYPWIDEYCLSLKSTKKIFKEQWNAYTFSIGEKMFALCGNDKEGKAIMTLKLEPSFGLFLRQQYKDIVPGYYMNKEHWNSLYSEGEVPDEVVETMIDQSYQIVLGSLSQKARKELME